MQAPLALLLCYNPKAAARTSRALPWSKAAVVVLIEGVTLELEGHLEGHQLSEVVHHHQAAAQRVRRVLLLRASGGIEAAKTAIIVTPSGGRVGTAQARSGPPGSTALVVTPRMMRISTERSHVTSQVGLMLASISPA